MIPKDKHEVILGEQLNTRYRYALNRLTGEVRKLGVNKNYREDRE